MEKEGKHLQARAIGNIFGIASANTARISYVGIFENAETEEDIFEVMCKYWQIDEHTLTFLFTNLPMESVKEGWEEGFLDTIYPLRQYV
jgi:hypothetical protein|tara:strand:+ start:46069 stop:46335 length:267 start_codon:yes stop_codon:yes gene_type:complete